ncbi:MAG: electron transfer flavoprotein subunit alpha/FixB family protein [Bacteroidales bacterium]|nr:electron transfer flavoprotein subunit alpha/FixB family protein [Bacteroidales bacterium]
MNNIFVYCEISEEGNVADVSLELLSKGRKLADQLGIKLEAIAIGSDLTNICDEVTPYGVDVLHLAQDKRLFPYSTLPHTSIIVKLFNDLKPEIVLVGATSVGRDLAPRLASALKCGLTADCTSLVIGDHSEKRLGKEYKNLLYQIRPAFGGNIVATIINPETRPQMATVREGVMKKEEIAGAKKPKVKNLDVAKYTADEDFVLRIIERHIEAQKINIKNATIIVAGGYGLGTKDNFNKLYDLADVIGAEVGATRAAVDAGLAEHERQIGQTGVTVRPKLYIACGISGAVQHRAGMEESAKIISINTDPDAPINSLADYTIIGAVEDVIPKMIKYYKKNSK